MIRYTPSLPPSSFSRPVVRYARREALATDHHPNFVVGWVWQVLAMPNTNRGVKALGKLRVHSSVGHAHEQRTSSWKTPMSRYTSLFQYHLSSDELHRLFEWRNLLFRHIRGVFFFFCVCAYVRFLILLVMKRITSLPSFLVSIVLFYLCIPHLMDLFNYGSIIHIEWLPGLIFIVITTVGEFS